MDSSQNIINNTAENSNAVSRYLGNSNTVQQDELVDFETANRNSSARNALRRFIPIGLDWTPSTATPASYNEILRHMFPSLALESTGTDGTPQPNLLAAVRSRIEQETSSQITLSSDRVSANVRRSRLLQRPVASTGRRTQPTNPSVHPQFRAKSVCKLFCKHCDTDLCMRGMKAILLGNTRVELFSTDSPPLGVQLVFHDYMTQNCACKIRDAACLGCGNVVGYHVTQPCESCLDACNNGHFWMFHSEGVGSIDRTDKTGITLKWAQLAISEDAGEDLKHTAIGISELVCR